MPKSSPLAVPLRVAPADPIPPPTPEPAPAWGRALGTHAWRLVPPMVVLPGGSIRVTLYCDRCLSWRGDSWLRRTGAIDAHAYKYSDTYRGQLDEERGTVRRGLIDAAKPRPLSAEAVRAERERARPAKGAGRETDHSRLRLVHGRKANVRNRARRRPR